MVFVAGRSWWAGGIGKTGLIAGSVTPIRALEYGKVIVFRLYRATVRHVFHGRWRAAASGTGPLAGGVFPVLSAESAGGGT